MRYNFLGRAFRAEPENNDVFGENCVIYIDGSELLDKAGCGIFLKDSNIRLSYKLSDDYSVFLAEVTAQFLLSGTIFPKNLMIFSDS